ncbi:thioester domain-containing protein [Amycolatopsis sp. QT-25]|uniref:thioester domain-containing protein n=1 Tax=Amycolatopsis sp. QT-25 TaxID=3034022 RepID=UPI0023EB1925|nr:thioester domain-containing protein [Amycolatopsis sp. QT-25]WET81587.1 thioester domain-containing protein [Amycolatopsis sp. QT-25]
MHGRSVLVRGGIAVATAAVALTMAAPAALADDGAARGRVVEGTGTEGFSVNFEGGQHYVAKLFGLKLSDGSKLKMYCVQVEVGMRTDQDMIERPWNKYPDAASPFNKNNAKINWVLHHGYPAVAVKKIESALGKDVKLNGGLSVEEAVTATQAAVWHFSDGKNLDRKKPLPHEEAEESADVLAVYDYLIGKDNVGIGQQPKPTLDIGPAKASGATGSKLGPFSIATSGDITELTSKLPEGVKVTDADGKEIKAAAIKDGTKVYIDVPKDAKDGNGSFSLKVSGHLDTGRLFVGENYAKVPAQSLIVAESEKTSVVANATASWKQGGAPGPETPAPTTPGGAESGGGDELANTGASATMPLVIGGALLGAGVLMVLLVRRRRSEA